MEWIPLTGYEDGMNMDDRPRRLNTEEIAYIVAHMPTAPAADAYAAEVARQGIIEWMIETLREVYICPSAVPELIQNIIIQHEKSLVAPGTPIGITAAEAVGASTTQMTLNSVAPWERILIQEINGTPHLVKIGEWIDSVIACDPLKVQHIPENRTQYVELESPFYIASPHEDGKVTWEKITAVTKHLPVGDMVKIRTIHGREVTATQSKSFLIWDGSKLVQREGKDVKSGDLVPAIINMPDPHIIITEKSGIKLDYKEGVLLGEYWSGNIPTHELSKWVPCGGELPHELLFTSQEFLRGFMKGIGDMVYSCDEDIEFIQLRLLNFEGKDIVNNVQLDCILYTEMVPATEYVYDLTVPTTTNFSLWNGLGVADTFHTSGSAKSASFGIEAMRDLIFARKNPKNETCTIYYTNKTASYEEILDTRRYIVGSMVSDFLKDYDIDTPQNLGRKWWHDTAHLLLQKQIPPSTKVMRLFLNTVEMYKHRVSISELASVLEREAPPTVIAIYGPISDGIIDLYPIPAIIIETLKESIKGVIPLDLTEFTYLESMVYPELKKIRVKGISGIKQLFPIVSPVWRMVILERKLTEQDLTNENLRQFLGPYFDRAWLLFYNTDIMRMTGLIPENLSALCQLAGFEIIAGTQDRLIVGMPDDRFRTANNEIVIQLDNFKYREVSRQSLKHIDGMVLRQISANNLKQTETGAFSEEVDNGIFDIIPMDYVRLVKRRSYKILDDTNSMIVDGKYYEELNQRIKITELKPNEYVSAKVAAHKADIKRQIKEQTEKNIKEAQTLPEAEKKALIRKPVSVPRTNLMKAAEFVIAETEGSNLKELLALPGIDNARTTCNNMYTIAETLGIEAARSFLIKALTNTISNTGSYVHPANIMFIAEFITSRGEPYGATYTGISRQPGGHLSLATLERAGKVFTQNALHGRKEDIRNVSASVVVGTRMAIGTGAFDIAQDIIQDGIITTVINDDLFTCLERDDNSIRLTAERAAVKPQIITTEDIAEGLDALKNITVGGATFDLIGAEDETNLLTLFTPGEIIPDITGIKPIQPEIQTKIVRRVQAQPIMPLKEPEIPRELVDVLAQIKIGIPLPEAPDKITITALETGVTAFEPPPQAIVSTGLIPLEELFPKVAPTGVPIGLRTLLNRYLTVVEEQEIVEDLPRVDIPQLPDLTGINLAGDLIAMRREQVQGLEMIDINALKTALENQ